MNYLKKNVVVNDNKKVALAIAAVFSFGLITVLINTIVNIFADRLVIADTVICYIVLCLFIFYGMQIYFRNMRLGDILFFSAFILVFAFSILINNDIIHFINFTFVRDFTFSLILYFLGRTIVDIDEVFDILKKVSYVIVLCAGLYKVLEYIFFGGRSQDMSYGYGILLFAMVLFYSFIKERNLKNFFYTAIGFLEIIISGTRGVLLCFCVFIGFLLLYNIKNVKAFIVTLAISTTAAFFYVTNTWIPFLRQVNNLLGLIGIHSRTLTMAISGNFTNDTGRIKLYEAAKAAIKSKPLTGYGILGDQLYLSHALNNSPAEGYYPHNLFLEIWCQFGLIIGSIILILFVVLIARGLRKAKTEKEKIFILMLIAAGVIRLFYSHSYLKSVHLALLLGFCANLVAKDKQKTPVKRGVYNGQ